MEKLIDTIIIVFGFTGIALSMLLTIHIGLIAPLLSAFILLFKNRKEFYTTLKDTECNI